jgi:hypothetical protein
MIPIDPEQRSEIEVRAREVECGDYLLGLGRVQSVTTANRITLHSEGNDWKVMLDPRHPVVVLRETRS